MPLLDNYNLLNNITKISKDLYKINNLCQINLLIKINNLCKISKIINFNISNLNNSNNFNFLDNSKIINISIKKDKIHNIKTKWIYKVIKKYINDK